jgi:hypothetical protein
MIKWSGFEPPDIPSEKFNMKKLVSLMLGLTLLAGAATVAFAQTDTNKQKAAKKKGKKGKKGTNSTEKKAQ